MWMFAGMLITAIVSYSIYLSPRLQEMLLPYYFILLIIELVVVLALSWKSESMSPSVAAGAFIFYALLNGITLTVLLMAYTASSVFIVFVIAAGMFIGMSLFGFFTKKDLSSIGRFAIMALIGIIIAMILNIFLFMIIPDTAVLIDFGISVIAVLIFAALTAYDTQKIKEIGNSIEYGAPYQNMAVVCALTLYLDFINLFIHLLNIFGDRD
jgi:FtsH-binding integral membrane protein